MGISLSQAMALVSEALNSIDWEKASSSVLNRLLLFSSTSKSNIYPYEIQVTKFARQTISLHVGLMIPFHMKNHKEKKLKKKFANCWAAHSESRMPMSITHCVLTLPSVCNLTICSSSTIREISNTSILLNLLNVLLLLNLVVCGFFVLLFCGGFVGLFVLFGWVCLFVGFFLVRPLWK